MAGRKGSTFEPMFIGYCAPPGVSPRVPAFILMQRHVSDHDRFARLVRLQLRRAREATNPDDLVSARDDRPVFSPCSGDVPLLKKFLDLPGTLRMGGPEPVPGPPV